MKNIYVAFCCEYKKVSHSKMLWITIVLFTFIPMMMGLMIYVVRHPEISAKMGLIAAKASLFGNADWPAFFGILHQSVATIGLIGYGFVAAWIFGREHSERTMKDLIALPISRSYIVTAKFLVAIVWCLFLSVILIAVGLMMGKWVGISGWSHEVFVHGMTKYFVTSFMTLLLITPVAFFAGYGRGIIVPIGFVIITLILSQFIAIAGFGAFFPWAIPGLNTVPEGTEGMQLFPISYVILVLTCLAGYLGTLAWWRFADHHS
ncbi:MAG: bacitracin ABC transporter permease [Bacteroidetes bacterium HGW-Bacteroidetes-21]|jgi:ABC-2 type transport system permease protein|nr:MAG: bacitracin ABC transporter permease [Bacteroidetes bacterium HGW-Bacteroidetes-21]